jgi:predicted acylesterase/phospholipase RssA
MTTFRVLSIDGGGIKGIMPAALLAEIEAISGRPCWEHFDLIVGTSTGGIIALALGLGIPAEKILSLYKVHGPDIFRARSWLSRFLQNVRGWIGASYSSDPLRQALVQVFGERTLGEARTRVVIPALSAVTGDVYLYKTPHHVRLRSDYRMKAVDVALATSAAPTYFRAHEMPRSLCMLDGGMWANNPLMVAVVEAISILGQTPSDVRVLSVGCTSQPMRVSRWMRRGGKIAWARGIADWLLHGQSITAVNHARLLLGRDRIIRIQKEMLPGLYGLDDYRQALELEAVGHELARSHSPEILATFFTEPSSPFVPAFPLVRSTPSPATVPRS